AAHDAQVFAHAVENDDGVVHRVPNESQQGRNNRQRYLKSKNREQTERNQNVVKDRQDGRSPVYPLEAKRNIYQHARQSIEGSEDGLLAELGADFGAHNLDIANGKTAHGEGVAENSHHGVGAAAPLLDVTRGRQRLAQLVGSGEQAAALAVAEFGDERSNGLVVVRGGRAEPQRVAPHESFGESGRAHRVQIRLSGVRSREGTLERVHDGLAPGIELLLVQRPLVQTDHHLVDVRAGHVHNLLDVGVAEAAFGQAGADHINFGVLHEPNVNQ